MDGPKREKEDVGPGGLRGARRRGIDLARPVAVRSEVLTAGEPLPLVVTPETETVDLVSWASGNREWIESRLREHGALLFRNFGVASVGEFERFAATQCPELFGEYGDLPRDEVSGKVYASTPYPADQAILFHNESAHMHRWPMKIFFSCVIAAESGGETPIVDCRRVFALLPDSMRTRFAERGLTYVRNYVEGLDVPWESFFQTSDRSAVERYCRESGIEFEWQGESGLQTRQRAPAVVRHPQTGEMAFFNQIQLHHPAALLPAVRESLVALLGGASLPRNVLYGDGSPIEDEVVQEIQALYERIAVRFPWQPGDILMVNNMLVAHSRAPFAGPRKVVVAMGEMVSQKDLEGAA